MHTAMIRTTAALTRATGRRWHSSSSWPPAKENSNQGEIEKDQETKMEMLELQRSSPLKKRIDVRAQALDVSLIRRQPLPSVPSTQYLDVNTVKRDMFLTGFRPILTPVKRPVTKVKRAPTKPLSWNDSACQLESFDDFSHVPQFVADKLVPFREPQAPGNEIRVGYESRKDQKDRERLSQELYDFLKHFRK